MKIIYLHQYFKFPDERGGTRSYDLAKRFVEEGHAVTVLTTTSSKNVAKGRKWSIVNRDGIEVHYIYIPYDNAMSYVQRIWAFLKFVLFSTLHLLKLKCDVVLATSTPLTIGIPALIKKWLTKTPYIFEVRDVWPEAVIAIGAITNRHMQKAFFILEKIIYKNAASIVPLSTDMETSIVERVPEVGDRIHHVIPNISELNRFSDNTNAVNLEDKLGFTPRFSVMYAGTFGRVNGLHKVVELASYTLRMDPSLCYILMGEGVLKKEIIDLAESSEVLKKNLFIVDSVSKDELSAWYASVSMGSSFVVEIKELWANSANKFFDTLAARKPVLINHEGWQAEVIREKNIGFVLNSSITEQIAEEFVAYTQNSTLHDVQAENAYELAKQEYSLDVASSRYLDILDKITLSS